MTRLVIDEHMADFNVAVTALFECFAKWYGTLVNIDSSGVKYRIALMGAPSEEGKFMTSNAIDEDGNLHKVFWEILRYDHYGDNHDYNHNDFFEIQQI